MERCGKDAKHERVETRAEADSEFIFLNCPDRTAQQRMRSTATAATVLLDYYML